MAKDYTKDSIAVLDDLTHIRLRRGMYIGEGQDPRQLFSEIFDNAMDEVQSGFSSKVIVNINTETNEYSVRDFGRGIPHGKKETEGGLKKEVIEVLLTKSNSGGKFNNDNYLVSCFTGDTKITLTDGRNITFEKLLEEFQDGKSNYTYSINNETRQIEIHKIQFVQKTKTVNKLMEIELDNGEIIHCTPEHKFIDRNFNFVQAQDLKKGQSLFPGYFKLSEKSDCKVAIGYNMIYDPTLNKYIMCHHLADEYNLRNNLYESDRDTLKKEHKYVRHHKDINKLNNNPDNILRCTWKEHQKLHPCPIELMRLSGYTEEQISEIFANIGQKTSVRMKKQWENFSDEEKQKWLSQSIHSEKSKQHVREHNANFLPEHNRSEKMRKVSSENGKKYGKENFRKYMESEAGRKFHSDLMTNMNRDPEINAKRHLHWDTIEGKEFIEALKKANQERNADPDFQDKCKLNRGLKLMQRMINEGHELNETNYINYKKSLGRGYNPYPTYLSIRSHYESDEELLLAVQNYNHEVVNIKEITCENTPVYDITIDPSADNFLLASGIFVKNCGLNGLGLTITNALSNYIEITSYRKKKFVKGTAHSSDKVKLEYGTTSEPDGTLVRFQPNKEMFHTDIIPIEFIRGRCEIANALGFNSELFVDGKQVAIKSNMFDLIKEGDNSFSTYKDIGPIEVVSSTKEKMKVAIRYTSDTSDKYFGFTNLLSNYLGGTHVQELSKAITNTWKNFLDTHKKFKPSVELRDNDYRVGLRGVCAVFISKPEFSSQTKEKLVVNKAYFAELMDKFQKAFGKFLNENELVARQLLKRFEEYRIAQNALLSRKEIGSLIKVNTDSEDNIRRKSVVSKLVECTSRKRDNTELFIVEGDSALGPYLYTRNKELQAVLPIRGKILNVTNKNIKEAIKNNEICDIANAIGAGIGGACDASKSRYERIILSADADEDGKQINCLLLSLFVNFFPDIIKSGRLFITVPPLYCWGDNKKNFGWTNDVESIPANTKNVERFKGLGAMNNDQLEYFLVNPKTRNMIQVDYPSNLDEFNRIMGTSSGKNDLYKELGIIIS